MIISPPPLSILALFVVLVGEMRRGLGMGNCFTGTGRRMGAWRCTGAIGCDKRVHDRVPILFDVGRGLCNGACVFTLIMVPSLHYSDIPIYYSRMSEKA